jgi:hypothetical protein
LGSSGQRWKTSERKNRVIIGIGILARWFDRNHRRLSLNAIRHSWMVWSPAIRSVASTTMPSASSHSDVNAMTRTQHEIASSESHAPPEFWPTCLKPFRAEDRNNRSITALFIGLCLTAHRPCDEAAAPKAMPFGGRPHPQYTHRRGRAAAQFNIGTQLATARNRGPVLGQTGSSDIAVVMRGARVHNTDIEISAGLPTEMSYARRKTTHGGGFFHS